MQTHIKPVYTSTNTFSQRLRTGLFLLSADVIAFLMVLEVITPRNVTCSQVLTSRPQHGSSEVPYTIYLSPLNDSINHKAYAVASFGGMLSTTNLTDCKETHNQMMGHSCDKTLLNNTKASLDIIVEQ